jgi:hypothetical protein
MFLAYAQPIKPIDPHQKRHGHAFGREFRGGRVNSRAVLAVAAVVAVVSGGVLFVGDSVPGESTNFDSTTTTVEATDTEAQTESSDGRSNTEDTTETATRSGYDFVIETIEKCGNTCRDVTARLTNDGQSTRRNVSVTTKVYADGDLLWSGNETVGTLDSGGTHRSTKRVDVGFSGGMAISANDGYVTIVTIVESEEETTRFSERRKVA